MNEEMQRFFSRFNFRPEMVGMIGVEREQFTATKGGEIIPASETYLKRLAMEMESCRYKFGYELSACQLESKIGPCCLSDLFKWLAQCENHLFEIDEELGLTRLNLELAPENMPLDIYPDPTGRYQVITEKMPKHILSAACRVAATHIHVGMSNLEEAIRIYNKVIAFTYELIQFGDGSSGERMKLYRTMAKRFAPETIASPEDFFNQAKTHGFVNDPRSCWTLIRISVHGTLEFRMFGASDSISQVTKWAEKCSSICFS